MKLSGGVGDWKNLPLARNGLVLVAIPLMLTAAVHLGELRAHVEVTRTLTVNQELTRTLVLVLDAESGVRGYLLTGDRRLLQPYDFAASSIRAQLARVRSALKDSGQRERLRAFERLCPGRFAILSEVSYVGEPRNVAPAFGDFTGSRSPARRVLALANQPPPARGTRS